MLAAVTCRVLTDSSEKESAAGIVYKKYKAEGYLHEEGESSNVISSFLRKDSSDTFGVFAGGEMYGTLSLIFDTKNGLPMDSIYKNEVDTLREKKYVLGEIVQFALDKELASKHLSRLEVPMSSLPLFGYLLSQAEKNKIDHLCISVNPKHVSFYSLIGFETFGEVKHYESVDAPAVAMVFSMSNLHSESFKKNTITKMIATFFNSDKQMV